MRLLRLLRGRRADVAAAASSVFPGAVARRPVHPFLFRLKRNLCLCVVNEPLKRVSAAVRRGETQKPDLLAPFTGIRETLPRDGISGSRPVLLLL